MRIRMIVFLLVTLTMFVPLGAEAGLVTGPTARAQFEEYRTSHLDMFVNFENIKTGPLEKLPGLPVILNTTEFRWPRPIEPAPAGTPVIVLPYDYVVSDPENHRLMGAVQVTRGPIPDGQSKYEIVFEKCLDRVGLLRMWNTYSTTSFFHFQDKIPLARHKNESNHEFVGYIRDLANPLDDCVTRVEFDGYPTHEKIGDKWYDIYQVGSVDDLYFSTPSVELDLKFYPHPNYPNYPIIHAGATLTATIYLKNLAAYENKNIRIKVKKFSHEQNKWVTVEVLRDIPPGKTRTLQFPIKTTSGPVEKSYFYVHVEIFSPTGNQVGGLIGGYYVIPRPFWSINNAISAINLLLLLKKLSE